MRFETTDNVDIYHNLIEILNNLHQLMSVSSLDYDKFFMNVFRSI